MHPATESLPETRHVLELTREFAAPRELVFRAWTTAEMAKRWWGCNEFPASHMEMDLRPGGRWRACLRSDEGAEIWLGGEFVEVNPPGRLVFTFVREAAPAIGVEQVDTRVSVVFTEQAGLTSIHFRQEFFTTAALRDSHETGWSAGMTRLHGILSDSAGVLSSTNTNYPYP